MSPRRRPAQPVWADDRLIDPVEAARLLRAARAAGPDEPEDVEWTFAAMPDSPSAHRWGVPSFPGRFLRNKWSNVGNSGWEWP